MIRLAMDLTTEILNKPDLSAVDLNKLKLVDLKKMCKAKGFSVAGSKNELISRLLQSLNPNADSTVSDVPEAIEEELLGKSPNDSNGASAEVTEGKLSEEILNEETEAIECCEPPEKKQKFTKIEAPPTKQSMDQKKLNDRMKRFGVVSEENKKLARAARFQSGMSAASGDDILKKRAERFNLTTTTTTTTSATSTVNDDDDDDVVKKRIARFGDVKEQPAPSSESSALSKRQARFGQVTPQSTDEAKLKRAQRFGMK